MTYIDSIAIVLAIGSLLLWGPALLAWLLWILYNLGQIATLTLTELHTAKGK